MDIAENVQTLLLPSPTYRIGEAEWNGVETFLCCKNHMPQDGKVLNLPKVIQVFEDIGMYVYIKSLLLMLETVGIL